VLVGIPLVRVLKTSIMRPDKPVAAEAPKKEKE
jgi:hypothetical protein